MRVVSMPSTSRFAKQEQAYRDEILLPGSRQAARRSRPARRWAGTAGSATTARAIGIDHFGASAPGPELAEKFGFTAERVAERARELLAS